MMYETRKSALVQRARQLKNGVVAIHRNNQAVMFGSGSSSVVSEALLNFERNFDLIERNAKPHVVGLAGDVSSGKSSFVNQLLLGQPQ
jgi:hypothetical protein